MLFDDLTQEEKAVVEKTMISRKFTAEECIVREGEEGRSLFVVKSGRAEARKDLRDDNYKHLKELAAGEIFGEMSFVGEPTRSASVIALDDCEVMELTVESFENLIKETPNIGLNVYRRIAQGLANRLRKNTDELKKALLWAIQGMDA